MNQLYPFFSIIIPLYNKCNSIKNTIGAVLNQSYPFFEIIVVDDGSTDDSLMVVKGIQDDRIRIFSQSNAGVSSARNKGISEAAHDLIGFLDADDLWEPSYLQQFSRIISNFPEAGLFGCAYDEVNGNISKSINFSLPDNFSGQLDNYFNHAKKNHLFWTSAVVIRKSVLEKSGGFDPRISIGEDLDLWFRIAYYFPVVFHNQVLAHYNTDAENRLTIKKISITQSLLFYFEKYKEMETDNIEFRLFINSFKIHKIIELYTHYQLKQANISAFIGTINTFGQPLKHRLFLRLPFVLQKMIIKILFTS